MKAEILVGDVIERLSQGGKDSAQCAVTSPPYWGLRDYGCEGQLGLEKTPELYIAKMIVVFRRVRDVLRNDGVLWLNIGDTYHQGNKGQSGEITDPNCKQATNIGSQTTRRGDQLGPNRTEKLAGIKAKDLVGIPWMLAFALRADGWYLRQDIIWSKPNPMPESVTDRCTKAHEYLFLLTKSARYFYDAAAIMEPLAAASLDRLSQDVANQIGSDRVPGKTNGNMKAVGIRGSKLGLTCGAYAPPGQAPHGNARAVRFGGAKYGDDARNEARTKSGNPWEPEADMRNKRSVWEIATQAYSEAHFATFPEALVEPCILAGSKEGDTVLDPFCGSGTTGAVALRYHRNFIGIELNPAYAALAQKRIDAEMPLFADVSVSA